MTAPALHYAYVPVVISNPRPFAGVQIDSPLSIPVIPGRIYQTPARWMGLDAWFDGNMRALAGNDIIIGSKTCPHPYRLWPDKTGSPPLPEYYERYADWASELCLQYQPWAFEVWNEPAVPNDIDDDLQYYFGAWVEQGGYYTAGRRYGELTTACYSWLNSLGVQIIGGSLVNTGETQLEFLQGALETGRFDYVSFHCYLSERDDFDKVFIAAEDIRQLSSLPLIMNETAVISGCSDPTCDTPSLRKRQAEYMRWLLEQGQWLEMPWLWYSQDSSWRNCGLMRYGEKTPAYDEWAKG